ncbi:hypothetical protein KUL113_24690 [Tenacibaculum sp. KUL113]|nr:hypothetical protein KUL113_24690 [Tenacibaculum sp. KUL113]
MRTVKTKNTTVSIKILDKSENTRLTRIIANIIMKRILSMEHTKFRYKKMAGSDQKSKKQLIQRGNK